MSQGTQILVLASQKGGSGKTTISGHLAVQAELAGAGPVALIDTDPQGSLAKWWNSREAQTPAFAQTSVPQLGEDIKALRASGYRLIVIDTPPAVTSTIAEVIMYADLVAIPIRPSPHDLRAVGPTVDIIEHQHKSLVFVVNSATVRARITGETAVALSQHGTVAPVTLHHRVDFAASMIDGRTVGEINPKSRSANEVAKLWSYLESKLARLQPAEHVIPPPRPSFETDLLTPIAASAMPEDEAEEHDPSADMELFEEVRPEPAFADGGLARQAVYHSGAPLMSQAPPPAAANADTQGSGGWDGIDRRGKAVDSQAAGGWDGVDRRGKAADSQASGGWDGVDRRKKDIGPPPGMPDRRRARVFGRRDLA
ncbi:MAG: hypothetical protein C0605_17425 [Hyphomicrobiales bacterium]|nr:MAG: hypothetical protein C0605_17425 [Hyphomicrobiales bacterium]